MKDEKNGRMNEITGRKEERQWDKLKDNTRQVGNKVSEKAAEGALRVQEQAKDRRDDAGTQATGAENRIQEKELRIDNRINESYLRAKDDLDKAEKDR